MFEDLIDMRRTQELYFPAPPNKTCPACRSATTKPDKPGNCFMHQAKRQQLSTAELGFSVRQTKEFNSAYSRSYSPDLAAETTEDYQRDSHNYSEIHEQFLQERDVMLFLSITCILTTTILCSGLS